MGADYGYKDMQQLHISFSLIWKKHLYAWDTDLNCNKLFALNLAKRKQKENRKKWADINRNCFVFGRKIYLKKILQLHAYGERKKNL